MSVDELFLFEDMIYYDGVFYGDWTVFGQDVLDKEKYQTVTFDQDKNNLPK